MRALLVAAGTFLALVFGAAAARSANETIQIGSKRFTESYILAEILVELAQREGIHASHAHGLGGTAVVYRALEEGSIDAYPDYTGTIAETIVRQGSADLESLRGALDPRGIGVSDPIGFENTYALAVRRSLAQRLGLRTISDLAAHKHTRLGLSHEFMGRADGWPGLASRYAFGDAQLSGLDHALAYEAAKDGSVDAIDVYTTDAKIVRYDLEVLSDDLHFFPPYRAVVVFRHDLLTRSPRFGRVLERLRGRIDEDTMRRLNARVELDGASFAAAARELLDADRATERSERTPAHFAHGLVQSVVRNGPRHVFLVLFAVLASTLIGVPLGVLAHVRPRTGAAILGVTGVVQTIPSLALFCFFIPLLGIGPLPALAALFLYGLLPVVRNTHAGLASVPADLREAAIALGLTPAERLRHVEVPLASRTIVAGIKTSAVVAVGSATIAAFIGAGGFGEPISTGLSLNDVPTILNGAVPAAALALIVQGAFAWLEGRVVPRGLREVRRADGESANDG
jgi:osmoprotectant transport system permease protein